MNLQQVKNQSVWRSLKILFFAAPILFLINIYFGFDNTLTVGEIPRWQLLIHLHGGSIGWITMCAIGLAIWHVTGDRDVDAGYERTVRSLVLAAVIAFAGYVPSFGLAFSRPSGFFVTLLPVFGTLSVLVLWAVAIFALGQLRRLHSVTTVQILFTGAVLTGAIGATVGALLGLERAIGQFLPLPPGDRVGAHAGMMDTYLFLVASGVIEWFTSDKYLERRSNAGLLQGVIWAVGAAIVPIAYFINMVDQLLPVFMLTLLVGLVIFLGRVAWRALMLGPAAEGVKPWAFFGTLWLIVYMATFLYLISQFVGGAEFTDFPRWVGVLFAHAGFVGMMTNLLFGVLSVKTWQSKDVIAWGEKTTMWLVNLGILVFVGVVAFSDSRLGAIVMGVGVLLGVFTMLMRLNASEAPDAAPGRMSTDMANA
ncbi:MAG: hypothetical protein PVF85_09195 [Anaerolineales bacterium]